jgi:two-component system chemotaxis response regulator CheY
MGSSAIEAPIQERIMAFNLIIVDDSSTTRNIIKRVLKMTDVPLGEIYEAVNGKDGLEKMRANWVDLVLADLNMPDMNGQEMIEEMSKDPLLCKLPVVVVSSEGNQTVLDSLAKKGVREFVRKPFEPGFLKEIIERSLGVSA